MRGGGGPSPPKLPFSKLAGCKRLFRKRKFVRPVRGLYAEGVPRLTMELLAIPVSQPSLVSLDRNGGDDVDDYIHGDQYEAAEWRLTVSNRRPVVSFECHLYPISESELRFTRGF